MIQVSQLTKTYAGNVQALRGVDLDIGTGMFGLVGPNGAGKTTLMRTIAGLLEPTSGKVTVFGNDISTRAGRMKAKAVLGYLPQDAGLHPDLTAFEFLDYIATLKGVIQKAKRYAQVESVLEMVRLSDVSDRMLKTYSGGMRQRVGIAQALLADPKVVIVDEPTVGLDPEERVRLRAVFADVATRCTIILSTHIIEDINQSCNDLAVIGKGKVLFRGSPRELMSTAHGYVSLITTDENIPKDLIVVSSVQMENATQYRVLGVPSPKLSPISVSPTLEDGYMWLMRGMETN